MIDKERYIPINRQLDIANSQSFFFFSFCSKQEHNCLKVKVLVPYSLIHVLLSGTPWTVACQVPLSMEFSRQEYWSELPCASPRDLPDLGIKLVSVMSPALADRFFPTNTTWQALATLP